MSTPWTYSTQRSVRLATSLLRDTLGGWRAQRSDDAQAVKAIQVALAGMKDLRGLPIKLAQLLHEMPEVVPEGLRSRFAAAFDAAPPLHPRTVHHILHEAFDRPAHEVFEAFHAERPVASASIGQVHHATYGGEPVVVKVQYPNLRRDIHADVRMIRGAMKCFAWSRPYQAVADELLARFLDELDYDKEAEALVWFGRRLAPLGVVVPRPIPQVSTQRVLTMSRIDGVTFDHWLAQHPSDERRAALSAKLFQAWHHLVVNHHHAHADMSRGNVMVGPDDTLAMIDFGSTRPLSPTTSGLVATLLQDPASAASASIQSAFETLGVLRPGDTATFHEAIVPVARWFAGPRIRKADPFDFTASSWSFEGRQRLWALITRGGHVGVHPEFVLLFRSMHGLYVLLEALQSAVPSHTLHPSQHP